MKCFNDNITYLIKSKQQVGKSKYVEKFLVENNIPFNTKFVEDFVLEDTEELINLLKLSLYEYDVEYNSIDNLLKLIFTDTKVESIMSQNTINEHNLMSVIHQNRKSIKLPIVMKDGISVIGFYGSYDDYQQFLQGKERENIKWLGGNPDYSDEQKVDWIIKHLGLPKRIGLSKRFGNINDDEKQARLYMPSTSILYGGIIKWLFPTEFIDSDGYITVNSNKKNIELPIKMMVKVGNIYKEKDFVVKVC